MNLIEGREQKNKRVEENGKPARKCPLTAFHPLGHGLILTRWEA
jgi:hypothetical protein